MPRNAQVHLICMPPSSENICKQSAQYHFVNDFLYRPVNTEEANSRPNVTLRYGDRYYPGSGSFEADESEYDRDEEAPPSRRPQQQQQQQQFVVRQPAQQQQFVVRQRVQQQPQPAQSQQLPVLSTPRTLVLQQQQPQQQQQQFARQSTQSPNQVFHSSEEINIPLQQRRPVPSQQRANFQQQDFDFRRK